MYKTHGWAASGYLNYYRYDITYLYLVLVNSSHVQYANSNYIDNNIFTIQTKFRLGLAIYQTRRSINTSITGPPQ